MSLTAIAPIEATVHATNTWLRELGDELGWSDPQRVYHAFRVVLHTLRDRLTVAETVDLGAQLPMLIRGLFYEGWTPNAKPVKPRKREEFLAPIGAAFRNEADVSPEGVAWAVFSVIEKHVSSGEIRDVKSILPEEIRSLWPRRLIDG